MLIGFVGIDSSGLQRSSAGKPRQPVIRLLCLGLASRSVRSACGGSITYDYIMLYTGIQQYTNITGCYVVLQYTILYRITLSRVRSFSAALPIRQGQGQGQGQERRLLHLRRCPQCICYINILMLIIVHKVTFNICLLCYIYTLTASTAGLP